MKTIYLIIGAPGSGKTWVCSQLKNEFSYIPHDNFLTSEEIYLDELMQEGLRSSKPVLAEIPFSISKFKEPLEAQGFNVIPVFIIEEPDIVRSRYERREGKMIPKGHLTRINTYRERARTYRAFSGTSQEVLEHLKGVRG